MEDIHYFFTKPSFHTSNSILLEKIYLFWKKRWITEFSKIGNKSELYSNDFFYHDLIGSIIVNNEPVSCCCYSIININSIIGRENSFLAKWWDEDQLQSVIKYNKVNSVFLPCSLVVDEKYKKTKLGIDVKDLVVALSILHFIKSDCSLLMGAGRKKHINSKTSVFSLFEPYGAKILFANIQKNNFIFDLSVVDKEEAIATSTNNLNYLYAEKIINNANILRKIENYPINKIGV